MCNKCRNGIPKGNPFLVTVNFSPSGKIIFATWGIIAIFALRNHTPNTFPI